MSLATLLILLAILVIIPLAWYAWRLTRKVQALEAEQEREEAEAAADSERLLVAYLQETILGQKSLEAALSYTLASKLKDEILPSITLRDLFLEIFEEEESLREAIRIDLQAVSDRDPAANGYLSPFLFFKGFSALSSYRFANHLWYDNRRPLALYLQSLISRTFGVDIHPAATIGKGIMIDHAHSIVIGETAVIGDNVSMLHSVTLGGTGKEDDDRHPKINDGVLIGAGAKVLGNITVGHCSRIAAGSVVLEDIPPMKTVAGVPAKVVGESGCAQPSMTMDQLLGCCD